MTPRLRKRQTRGAVRRLRSSAQRRWHTRRQVLSGTPRCTRRARQGTCARRTRKRDDGGRGQLRTGPNDGPLHLGSRCTTHQEGGMLVDDRLSRRCYLKKEKVSASGGKAGRPDGFREKGSGTTRTDEVCTLSGVNWISAFGGKEAPTSKAERATGAGGGR